MPCGGGVERAVRAADLDLAGVEPEELPAAEPDPVEPVAAVQEDDNVMLGSNIVNGVDVGRFPNNLTARAEPQFGSYEELLRNFSGPQVVQNFYAFPLDGLSVYPKKAQVTRGSADSGRKLKNPESVLRAAPSRILNTGRGIFAGVSIPNLVNIGQYAGTVIPPNELAASQSRHVMTVNGQHIDGSRRGNYTSVIQQAPLRDMVNVVFDQGGHFFTIRDIRPGEELYTNYGPDYWKD